jgi:two-component system response regulator ChvI
MNSTETHSAVRVMVVDDDDLFRESLSRNLTDVGFQVSDFSSGPLALDHLAAGNAPDVAIFDWRMPAMTGIELLRRMRQNNCELPVIFLTALTDQMYEEAALATGAVDFVEKARSFGILHKRIQLILEGAKTRSPAPAERPSNDAEVIEAGHLTLKSKSGRALWKGVNVELSLTEFRIVGQLIAEGGNEVPYRSLYDLVRGSGFFAGIGEEGYRANVRTFIKRIRHKFREIDPDFDAIENYAGFGYRWKHSQ